MSIKDRIKNQMIKLGLWAATIAPIAPTNAEAATPDAPTQPKTEQYAPNQEDDDNNPPQTFRYKGMTFTPVSEVPNSNAQQTTRRQTVSRQTQPVREVSYGSPEWLRANGWVRLDDHHPLVNGLNRIGSHDGSECGYSGVYRNINNPDKILYLPQDPVNYPDQMQVTDYTLAKSNQRQKLGPYSHANHDPHGYGCPDQKRDYGYGYDTPRRGKRSRAGRIIHGAAVTLDAIIRANHGR